MSFSLAKTLFAKNSFRFASQVPKFIKFEYDDPLNLKSLLSKEELEVINFQAFKFKFSIARENKQQNCPRNYDARHY